MNWKCPHVSIIKCVCVCVCIYMCVGGGVDKMVHCQWPFWTSSWNNSKNSHYALRTLWDVEHFYISIRFCTNNGGVAVKHQSSSSSPSSPTMEINRNYNNSNLTEKLHGINILSHLTTILIIHNPYNILGRITVLNVIYLCTVMN